MEVQSKKKSSSSKVNLVSCEDEPVDILHLGSFVKSLSTMYVFLTL